MFYKSLSCWFPHAHVRTHTHARARTHTHHTHTYIYTSLFHCMCCCMSVTSHPPWLHHKNDIQCHIKIIKLLTKQYFPVSCYFFSLATLSSNILRQSSSLNVKDQGSHPQRTRYSDMDIQFREHTQCAPTYPSHSAFTASLISTSNPCQSLRSLSCGPQNHYQVLRKDSLWIVVTQAMLVCGCLNLYVDRTKIWSFHIDAVKALRSSWDVTLCCWTSSCQHVTLCCWTSSCQHVTLCCWTSSCQHFKG
jgi:hypothetical protein